MPSRTADDVIVVGAGVIGLSVAWRAAVEGMSVTLVDPRPGRGSSWAAAGMLAPVAESQFGEEHLTPLFGHASRLWPDFALRLEAATGMRVHYRREGALLVAVDPSDRVELGRILAHQIERGLAARPLDSRECRASEPLLAPGIRGGAELPEDHQVDNRCLVDALQQAAAGSGVSIRTDSVDRIDIEGGRVVGVTVSGGERLNGAAVVVAAGCRSGAIDGLPEDARPPVRPVKGMTLRLRAPDGSPGLRRTVRGLVHGRSCYLVPRDDGSVVVGAKVEERGYDLAAQAGSVYELLADGRLLVPAIDEYQLVETSTGLRPGSPDNAPIVGMDGTGGLLIATGHYRNGILLAPATADEVVRRLQGEGPSKLFDRFGPDRFGEVGPAVSPVSPVGGPGHGGRQ